MIFREFSKARVKLAFCASVLESLQKKKLVSANLHSFIIIIYFIDVLFIFLTAEKLNLFCKVVVWSDLLQKFGILVVIMLPWKTD